MIHRIQLEHWGDIACPWCFIGHRRVMQALHEQASVDLRLRAYQLQPELPPEGVDPGPFFEKILGDPQRRRTIFSRVQEAAQGDDIRFDFARVKAPNTKLAHRVVAIAARQGKGPQALDALFRGHFEEGADVARPAELVALIARHQVGIEPKELLAQLAAGEGTAEVEADLARAAEIGIDGVPFLLADSSLALQGAQPVEVLVEFLAHVRRERPIAQA